MRGLLIGLVLAATACATPPARADDIAYDPAPLQRCIADSGIDAARLQACKGAGANPCREVEGDSTMSMVLCWDREANTWREAVDALVARLASAAPAHADALHSSQEAWLRWVDIECGYRADLYEGGSGAQVEQVTCAAGLAAERASALLQTEANL